MNLFVNFCLADEAKHPGKYTDGQRAPSLLATILNVNESSQVFTTRLRSRVKVDDDPTSRSTLSFIVVKSVRLLLFSY